MTAYYNEIDPKAAEWLRELIKQGHIAPGVVDERSILDVKPDELAGFTQVHFFAGIGVWSYALRQAGWADDRPVWTGSCPCQPFSTAGKRGGFDDERHLWPAMHWLIEQCRPITVFGEQVASKDGLGWIDLVQTDLESSGYTSAALDLCSAGFGGGHIRQRLYWMAQSASDRCTGGRKTGEAKGRPAARWHDKTEGANVFGQFPTRLKRPSSELPSGVAHSDIEGSQGRERMPEGADKFTTWPVGMVDRGSLPSHLGGRPIDWLFCRDNKWRPVEPGTSPLANESAARVVRLRGYGNAIDAKVATEFVKLAIEELDS
jgi:DNA (cytosine-5)-methyltransferase 1